MLKSRRLVVFVALALALLATRSVLAYIEAAYSLGRVINEAIQVMVLRVEKVDREKNLIVFRKDRDLKGSGGPDVIKHNISKNGFHPREWQTIMNWAEPGKTAVFFHNGGASETCIDNYWYQSYAGGEWWNMSHGEPYLLRSFAGKADKLAAALVPLLAGQEVIVPCMVDGDKNALQLANGKIQRMKASLKIQDYDPKRDFAGWGGEDFRELRGMPGFGRIGNLSRVDPGASGIAPADFDGDGRIDLCLFGGARVSLLRNTGSAFDDVPLPVSGGARAAGWADYNQDGKPDLLLATPTGPRLLTNRSETFKDDSALLPREPYYNLTAAAWIDDGDGRPDLVLANGFLGLRYYRNLGTESAKAPPQGARPGPWHYIGPFDNAGGRGFDAAYPPESSVDRAATYPGKNGAKAAWKDGNFPDGQVNNLALFDGDKNNDAVVYVQRDIDCGAAVDLPVSLGSDDSLKVWLNGEKIHAENTSRACAPDQARVVLKLRAGKNSLLLKIGQGNGEWAFYFEAKAPTALPPPWFEDATARVGLDRIAPGLKGDHLAVADVNRDGRPDLLYSAGPGLLVLNTPGGFDAAPESGIRYQAGGVVPCFGDYDGDGAPDLYVPQRGAGLLFHNDGHGKFTDVTARAGDLTGAPSACGSWADFDGDGRLDLFAGRLKDSDRYYHNEGAGRFRDASAALGLDRKIFNTRALAALPLWKKASGRGLDLVLNNEGQEPAVLIGRDAKPTAPSPGAD